MSFDKRLKKLEEKKLPEKKIMVVKYGNELRELSFHGEMFTRLDHETEADFINRARKIVKAIPNRPDVSILVGNF